MIPLELTFRHVDKTPALQELVEQRVQKLDQLGVPIMRCRAVVERPNRNNTSGSPYRVRLDLLTPPGQELVIDEKPRQHDLQEPLKAIIRQAFDTTERQIPKCEPSGQRLES